MIQASYAVSLGVLVQHALVLFLIVGLPLWDWYEIPRLKASTEARKKVRYYKKIVSISWALLLLVVLSVGGGAIFIVRTAPGEIAWLDAGTLGRVVLQGMAAGALIAILLPAILALKSEKIRTRAGKAARKLVFLLPSNAEERRWWWVVCFTAGICEEVVYRGFLLHYLHVLPFRWSLTWALAMSSLIFGIAHLYQGISAAVGTVAIGFLLGALFLMTGSLALPIALHVVLDLRVLAMLPEGFDREAA